MASVPDPDEVALVCADPDEIILVCAEDPVQVTILRPVGSGSAAYDGVEDYW